MTTAHRATWNCAKGSSFQGGNRIIIPTRSFSSRDLPGYLIMKYRKLDVNNITPINLQQIAEEKKIEDEQNQHPEDQCSSDSDKNAEEEEDESSSDNESDQEQELLLELEKIKRQREQEKEYKDKQIKEQEKKQRQLEMMKGNPLLKTDQYSLKKKWTEDTVFKNQARQITNSLTLKQKTFINDTVRSHFHKKFLSKYIQ